MKRLRSLLRRAITRFLPGLHALQQRLDDLELRLDDLELLLTEHPNATPGDIRHLPFASPAVTIVMPTWNRAGIIEDAIRSVENQRFTDWELIVVDDGSTDNTGEVIAALAKRDPRIRYVTQAHAGQSAARNRALHTAKGELIAYLDSDNVWYSEFLATAVALFGNNPEMACAYGAMVAEPPHVRHRLKFDPFDRARLLDGNYIPMSTLIHRRTLVDQYGGFDEQLATHEDWDLVLRYTEHRPAYRIPVLAVRKRIVDRNVSTRPSENDFRRIKAKWQKSR